MKTLFLIDLKINFISIAALFAGLVFGMLLLIIYYSFFATKKISKKEIKKSPEAINLSSADFQPYIDLSKEKIRQKKTENGKIEFSDIKASVFDLVITISSKYYPDSKYPFAELTFEEMIELDRYIADQLDAYLDKKIFNVIKIRNMKLSTALKMANKKEEEQPKDENKNLFRTIQKNISKSFQSLKKKTLKPVLDKAILVLVDKIIDLVGEETYQVYSKNIFDEPVPEDNIKDLEQMYSETLSDDEKLEPSDFLEIEKEKSQEDKDIEEMNLLINQTTQIKKDWNIFSKFKKRKK